RIIKLDSTGVRQTLVHTAGNDFAVDDSGNVYITRLGWYPDPNSNQTRKFGPSGSLVWSLNRGGQKLRLDNSGNVFVNTYWTWNDTVAFKINEAGMLEWSAVSVDWSGPIDFAVDGLGNLYLCGLKWSGSYLGESDFYAVKYNSSGALEWSARYNGPGNSSEIPYTIGVDGSGNVFMAGMTQNENHANAITLVKYAQVQVSVEEEETGVPLSYSLSQNYPNPFNPTTAISYQLTATSFVSLKVFDVLGREVATLVNKENKPGSYTVTFSGSNLSSGVYFYRLQAGEFVATKKLMLLR
ncbi:MAG: repeat protein, partial [Bacteroidetes bacterium]|nr:repeat protein [Bacteroidota bacterium]